MRSSRSSRLFAITISLQDCNRVCFARGKAIVLLFFFSTSWKRTVRTRSLSSVSVSWCHRVVGFCANCRRTITRKTVHGVKNAPSPHRDPFQRGMSECTEVPPKFSITLIRSQLHSATCLNPKYLKKWTAHFKIYLRHDTV